MPRSTLLKTLEKTVNGLTWYVYATLMLREEPKYLCTEKMSPKRADGLKDWSIGNVKKSV
jgi:hypothetical protein